VVNKECVPAVVAALAAVVLTASACADAADLAGGPASPTVAPETSATATESSPSTPEPTPTATETATATPEPQPEEPIPAVGDCSRLPLGEAVLGVSLRPSPRVPCSKGHNAQTYFVGRIDRDTRAAVRTGDRTRVYQQAADRCRRQLLSWTGGEGADLALSQLAMVVGVPTISDLAAGADWLRCDLVVWRTQRSLQPLPRNTRNILATPRADRYDICAKGDIANADTVLCSLPHRWRGASAVRLGSKQEAFPGGNIVSARMRSVCETRVRSYLGTTSAFNYGWIRPTKASWNLGDRYGVCFANLTS